MRKHFLSFLAFGACVALLGVMEARAETINITNTSTNAVIGTLSYTRDTSAAVDSGLDTITFNLDSFVATGTTLVNGLNGTWSSVGAGKSLFVGEADYQYKKVGTKYQFVKIGDWVASTLSGVGTSAGDSTSCMGFSSVVGGNLNMSTGLVYDAQQGGLLFARGGTWDSANQVWAGTETSYLTGAWFSQPALSGTDTLATFYVTTGGDVSFAGELGTNHNGSPVTLNVTFTTAVPEPGTLALLAAGLFGLLAYAWRKRR